MPDLQHLWLATLTHGSNNSGTKDRPVLIINQNGVDLVHHTFEAPKKLPIPFGSLLAVMPQGNANLFHLILEDAQIVSTEFLSLSSVRIGLAGSDLWRPQHILVWGRTPLTETFLPYWPVAAEMDIEEGTRSTTLSIDDGEGVTSLPLRTVERGFGTTNIERLVVILTTEDEEDAGTHDQLELVTIINGNETVYPLPTDTSQEDLEQGYTNMYVLPVTTPLTLSDLNSGSMRLRTTGDDKWDPSSIFVFGLDTASGRPQSVMPLVHEFPWTRRPFSTDASEGATFQELEIISF